MHVYSCFVVLLRLTHFTGLLCTSLHAAALHCDTAVLMALIEAKANVEAKAEARYCQYQFIVDRHEVLSTKLTMQLKLELCVV